MDLLRLREQKQQLEDRSHEQEKRISGLGSEKEDLNRKMLDLQTVYHALTSQHESIEQENRALMTEKSQLSSQLGSMQNAIATGRQKLTSAQDKNRTLKAQLNQLRSDYGSQKKKLDKAQNQIWVTDKRLADLQGTFDDLKIKYDKLVKPARTAKGKYVFEVRHFKRGGVKHIEYKEPGQASFKSASKSALESRLSELRQSKPDSLYIKVIFPEDSGLSYAEAWKFTTNLHKNYDYYFRDAAGSRKKPQ